MRENTWIIWLVMLAGALVLEALSKQLFSVWFALGAGAALLACALGAPVWIQVPLFVAVTALALLASRPLVRKLHRKAEGDAPGAQPEEEQGE